MEGIKVLEKVQQIYDLLYSPIVTPLNLIENAKLKNYEYVKYYKLDEMFVAEMKCNNLSGDSTIFYYHFDDNNFLERIYQQQDNTTSLVFDRKQNTIEKRNEYLKARNKSVRKTG